MPAGPAPTTATRKGRVVLTEGRLPVEDKTREAKAATDSTDRVRRTSPQVQGVDVGFL
ncbi:hypothetical protein GCM10010413_01310 [Promicromonospora sukumoe]